jgi:prepilin-type N-terminal cleavage/methylation domain-containing protein
MKRPPLPRHRAAFTLIEILTVIAIIAMLGALGFAGLRYAMNKAREKDTMTLITDIGRAIEGYRADRGNYPRPSLAEEETVIDGESFRIGGARMLYQVLSGDGEDAIKGGEKVSTGIQGSAKDDKDPDAGTVYMDTIQAPTKQQIEEKKKLKLVDSAGEASFYIIDAWRHPLQYQVADRDKNGEITNDIEMHSSSNFELWSYGNTKKADDSEEGQKKWITNWGLK